MENPENNEGWVQLYRWAVTERDTAKLVIRISEAQDAIKHRTRELWYAGAEGHEELNRLHAAFRYLDILRAFGSRGRGQAA